MKELPKVYEPQKVEKKIYDFWMQGGWFKGVIDPGKKPFSIVMPPPNVTGQLHMGHAMDSALQDIITRYKRMQGYAALWLPGVDHAGIATQIKVEEFLRKEEGKTRYDLGRDKFLERVWAWKEQYGGRIVEQQKSMGVSCDWDRSRFTMDETCAKAVRETFCDLYEKGLIYKGRRIINWCPHCRTALSDAEVEYKDIPGHFWYIRYPIEDSEEFLTIATTRPETMLGDSGVAVHPEDERYAHLVGKNAILPLVGRKLPIVADEYVELGFGTGAVKMTPCHDPNDFEVGLRHDLEQIQVIDEDAKICGGYKYDGMDRYEARKAIVADLTEQGYLVKTEPYSHNVGCCYRCGTVVEPLTSPQWFVKMAPLARKAIEVVKDGRIKFVPERFSKTYMNWMENVHDWCISRQLWWGHQIPAWTCEDCGHVTVSRQDPCACESCRSKRIRREEDVLDTWFSSALWPFSTMGWPDKTPELDYWYPTTVMVTGYDIIFFWVARMAFQGRHFTKNRPFKDVLIHGLIRDAKGRKMSKSLGNGIDPMEVIDEYGVDALRFFLTTNSTPGQDMRYIPEKVEASWNFINKIWNASRFVLLNLPDEMTMKDVDLSVLSTSDLWILNKLNLVLGHVSDNMEKYEFALVGNELYSFVWNDFCSWYIELSKASLSDADPKVVKGAQSTLLVMLNAIVRLLHPFMPFVTEEIYQMMPHDMESICIESWPKKIENLPSSDLEGMDRLISVIQKIREVKTVNELKPSAHLDILVKDLDGNPVNVSATEASMLERLARVSYIPSLAGELSVHPVSGGSLYIPSSQLMDIEAEKARLASERERLEKEVERSEKILSNPRFLAKAPRAKVENEQRKMEDYRRQLEAVIARADELGK